MTPAQIVEITLRTSMVRLRAYGNAINAAAAQAFTECVMQ